MRTEICIRPGSAAHLEELPAESVDLVVTSPPYPMIQMWDEVFVAQDPRIGTLLDAGGGHAAFERMHAILDRAWRECDRVLRPGGIVCVNIGDATRTLGGDFQLYSNHARILAAFRDLGYAALPDILWRKQTNAPNKFMGSGMLPVGAYVTYEHEYVLILRKGPRRAFASPEQSRCRRRSAFFWEERNVWFSDVWVDLKGAHQELGGRAQRKRSGAFPFELAYRLVCMFSIRGDHVLDPFAGTGTTLCAALAAGRAATGVELDPSLVGACWDALQAAPALANRHARDRLLRHMAFVDRRLRESGPLKHVNEPYGFPVVTGQERELLIPDVVSAGPVRTGCLQVEHADQAQADMVEAWLHDHGEGARNAAVGAAHPGRGGSLRGRRSSRCGDTGQEGLRFGEARQESGREPGPA